MILVGLVVDVGRDIVGAIDDDVAAVMEIVVATIGDIDVVVVVTATVVRGSEVVVDDADVAGITEVVDPDIPVVVGEETAAADEVASTISRRAFVTIGP
jgi:hypothetical protein